LRSRVHGDAALRDFQRQRLGKAMHAGLRGGIVGLPKRTARTVHRADIDDTAITAFHHARQKRFGHVEQTIEMPALLIRISTFFSSSSTRCAHCSHESKSASMTRVKRTGAINSARQRFKWYDWIDPAS
jgi:hypothetical protein